MLDNKDCIYIFLLICLLNIVPKNLVDAEKSEDSSYCIIAQIHQCTPFR